MPIRDRYPGYKIQALCVLIRIIEAQITEYFQTPFTSMGNVWLRKKRMRLKALKRQLARAIAEYVA
jgi:hypothetical protein